MRKFIILERYCCGWEEILEYDDLTEAIKVYDKMSDGSHMDYRLIERTDVTLRDHEGQ